MKQINLLKLSLLVLFLSLQQYSIAAVTTGTYTVGPGGNYADLAEAITDLNTSVITGPVIFDIIPGSYSGANWQVQLNGITGSSAVNTVTFRAQGGAGTVNITVTGIAGYNYIFKLADVNNVIVKDLALANNSSTGYGIVYQLAGTSANNQLLNCTLTGPVTTSVSDNMAVVHLGYNGISSLAGGNNIIRNNIIQNGSIGITLSGSNTPVFTTDDVIENNNISGSSVFGIIAAFAANPKISTNTINGSGVLYNSGLFLNSTGNGLDVSANNITINTTSTGNNVYGIRNAGTNISTPSTSASTTVNNNTVSVTVTTGIAFPLQNNGCYKLSMTGNSFTGVTTGNGTVYPPELMSYCVNSSATNNTFTSTATGAGSIAAGTYYFMYNATSCTVRLNTFNNTTTSGNIFGNTFYLMAFAQNSVCNRNIFNYNSTTGSIFNPATLGNWLTSGGNISMDSNKFNIISTTGIIGNTINAASINGWSSGVSGSTLSFSNNNVTVTSSYTGTSYGIWGYNAGLNMNAGSIMNFVGDTLTYNLNGGTSTTMYIFGVFTSYPTTGPTIRVNNNIIAVSAPNGIGTLYSFPYYIYANTNPEVLNNKVTVITTTAGTIYSAGQYPMYICTNGQFSNNTVSVTATSGTIYNPYSLIYSSSTGCQAKNNIFTTNTGTGTTYMPQYALFSGDAGCKASGNTFNYNSTSTGTFYNYSSGYTVATNTDTFENNTYNVNCNGGTLNNYQYAMGGTVRNNTYNLNNTTGTIYGYFYYPNQGLLYEGNTLKMNTTSGTIYSAQVVSWWSTTSDVWTCRNNIFDARSSAGGTIYGFYTTSTPGGGNIIGNVFSARTSGATYMLYNTGTYADYYLFNNTFHSNSTGSINQLIYSVGSSTTYPGKMQLFNNVFSSSNNVSNPAVQYGDTNYCISDYNLFYSPNTPTLITNTPATSSATLAGWRTNTKRDQNSLFYNPGYRDAVNFDFRPDPANPNAWSLQGRGRHLPGDTLDIVGNVRAKTPVQGVPDIGAYEFDPTTTPPDAVATPATPAAGTTQVFTFGGDTVASIAWGVSAPTSVSVKQYTGRQAATNPATVPRMFFYTAVNAATGVYDYKPYINYKNPWIGNISSETNARIAKSSNGGIWQGYNYTNSNTDSVLNKMSPRDNFDSLSSAFTGVENARIGVRCFYSGPTGISFSLIGADSAIASWDPVFSPAGYQIIVDQIPFDPAPPYSGALFISGPVGNFYTMLGLTEDTKYYVHIRTICQAKDTSVWSTASFSTLVRCHAPTLGVTSITDVRAIVYWDTVKTGSQYEYVIDQNASDPQFGTMTQSRSVLATGLLPATDYYAHVRSFCNNIYNTSVKPDGSPLWSTLQFKTLFPASVSNSAGAKSGLSIYPNPVKEMLTIQLFDKIDGNATIAITDVTGKVLRNIEVTGMKMEVNIATLPTGMYLLKYTDRSRIEISKLNKE
jgi:parallel beta-helix repeat protein